MGNASSPRDQMPQQIHIQSKSHEELLNIIDSLRSQGISRYIDLPQIIVCGDQSSGKSSVLEAVSGLRFPTKDALCTRFATELILRRNQETTAKVSIVPDAAREDHDKIRLSKFRSKKSIFEDFGGIIEEASKEMGLQGNTKVFSTDVLRIELSGPKQPHLTLVDLPGLFHAGSKTQSDTDAEAVKSLVTSYMQKSRSIILAVVSAKNDYNNQIVTKYARDFDPNGDRTLGIITKPDTLPRGSDSEKLFFELAENKDVNFKLGWHVLKNRDYETRDCTNAQRDEAEIKFFNKGIWTSLSPNQMGVGALRPRLSRVLQNQILSQLPGLIRDVASGVQECDSRLKRLGKSRDDAQKQQVYLHEVSQTFSKLLNDSINGYYEDEFFSNTGDDDGYAKRIRAVVTNSLERFEKDMRLKGHRTEVASTAVSGRIDRTQVPCPIALDVRLAEISELIRQNRGKELPGFTRAETISMLFRDQSAPWAAVAKRYTKEIFEAVRAAVLSILDKASDPATRDEILKFIINPGLERIKIQLDQKVLTNLRQHTQGHPITFNHYFTDNIQKLRQSHNEQFLATRLKEFFDKDPLSNDCTAIVSQVNTRNLLTRLATNTEADMMKFACSEALYFMQAYYKVALKFFIDDFGIHTIEQGLMEELPSIFDPVSVLSLGQDMIEAIAGETEESRVERISSESKRTGLKKALNVLHRLDRGQPRAAPRDAVVQT